MTDHKLGILLPFSSGLVYEEDGMARQCFLNWRTKTSPLCQAAGRVPGFCNRAIWQKQKPYLGRIPVGPLQEQTTNRIEICQRHQFSKGVLASQKKMQNFMHLLREFHTYWVICLFFDKFNEHIFSFVSNGHMLRIKHFLRKFLPPKTAMT